MFRKGWSDRGGQPAGSQQPSHASEDQEMRDEPAPPDDNNEWVINDQSQAPSGPHVNNSDYAANRMTHWPTFNGGTDVPEGYHINTSGQTAGYFPVTPSYSLPASQAPYGSHVNNSNNNNDNNGHSAGYYPAQPSHTMSQSLYGSHVDHSAHSTSYHSAQRFPYSLSSCVPNTNNNQNHSVSHYPAQGSHNLSGYHAPNVFNAINSGHTTTHYPSQPSYGFHGNQASYGSFVNNSAYSTSHHPAETSYKPSGFNSSDSLYVNHGEDSTSRLPSQGSYSLAERRSQDPLSVIVATSAKPDKYALTQKGDNYQPESIGYSGNGKGRATNGEKSYGPETVAHTGKGKGRATNVEDHPPTPPPKDPIGPGAYSGKGKGRAIDVEDDPPTLTPKNTTMEAAEDMEMDDEFFQTTTTSPTKCLISPMRKLMDVAAQLDAGTSCGSPTKPAFKRDIKGKGRRVFNLLESIFTQNDITLNVTRHMEVRDFLTLYCISKKFYWLVNSHMTTYMMSMARVHAPLSMRVFPYTYRRSLCILDPVLRDHPTNPSQRGRVVPSLKWLQMLAFREAVSHDILLAMALEGHRFPNPIQEILLKIWMMLDLPRTALRLSVIRNNKIWHSRDLFIALMFFMKLDMRLSDPIVGEGECLLSKLFLAQRSLEPLWEALRGWRLTNETELLAMIVEWDYAPLDFENDEREPIFGVPAGKVGSLCCEDWTPGRPVLLRPDEVILGECIRRQLDLNRCFVDFMLWGYVSWRSGYEIPLPDNEELKRRYKDKLGYDDCLVGYRKALAAAEKANKLRQEQKRKEAEEKAQQEAAAAGGSGAPQQ
ncbi:hypothetical protein IWZ00DRAFT_330602 [Phyllosticta capitalensis]|uniref:uncharacterized protein n=1 Tax=Phyllosticta capitalensis TaxID=121624 RepID=UPI0031300273